MTTQADAGIASPVPDVFDPGGGAQAQGTSKRTPQVSRGTPAQKPSLVRGAITHLLHRPALALDPVEANAAIDGTAVVSRLLYSGDGQQPRPYAQARWTMSPPQLVTQRLREAFSATRPVVDIGAGLAAVELRAQLDEFAHVFSAPGTSEGVVRLRLTLIAPSAANRLLGQHTIVVRKPAASADAAGGVSALRAATDDAVNQAVAWVQSVPMPAR